MSLLVKNGCFFVDQKRLDLTLSLAPEKQKESMVLQEQEKALFSTS